MKNYTLWPLFSQMNTPAVLELPAVGFSLDPTLYCNKCGTATDAPLHSSVLYVVPESFPEAIYQSFFFCSFLPHYSKPQRAKLCNGYSTLQLCFWLSDIICAHFYF